MASYQGTREKQLSTYSAMEGQARQSLARAREKQAVGNEMMAPPGGPSTNVIMGAGSQRQTRNRESFGHFRSWVYVCVDAIARRIAGQELSAGEIENAEQNPDRERSPRAFHKQKSRNIVPAHRAWSVPSAALKYIGGAQQLNCMESHESLDLLARPNEVQRKFEFLYMSAANLLLTGECYWIGAKEAREGQGEVWAVPTTWMTPVHDGGLFTSFMLQVGGQAIAKEIPAEMVARTYFADPADLKSAYSPLRAIVQAIKVDDYIQESQKQMFERGINPNLIVTVGRVRGEDGTLTDRRPVLSGPNRRQIIRAIREIWNQTVSTGDPAILDGLIESVHKLHNTPQEMDWPGSGEIVKKRVMQGYKVNPIVVGEVTAGNRAQAVEAEKNFCGNAVNPIANALSETLTEFVGPWYEQPKRLVVWIDEAIPTDPDQELKQWTEARKNEDVTQDEFRANILGIPPLEKREDPAKMLNQQGGMTGIAAVNKAIAAKEILPEQGSLILQTTLRLPKKLADDIAGVGMELPEPPPPPVPPETPPDEEAAADDEDPPEDEDTPPEDETPPDEEAADRLSLKTRKTMQDLVRKQAAKLERGLGRSMAEHFRGSLRRCAAKIRKLEHEIKLDPENAETQAGWIVAHSFDPQAEYLDTVETALPWIGKAIAEGAYQEVRLLAEINRAEAEKAKGVKTTAEDIIARLDLPDLGGGISAGEAPRWFRSAVNTELRETFERDYWTQVDFTTQDDIRYELQAGLRQGQSIRDLARGIEFVSNGAYPGRRALLVARTEMTGAMNAGHAVGIQGTADETGLPIGKEWVSVMGNTTRRTHADADGETTATPDGQFSVGGFETPYPGWGGLPARERCNCQCTIISSLAMESLDNISAANDPETPEVDPGDIDSKDTAVVDAMPVKDVIAGSKNLEKKHKKFETLRKALEKETAPLITEQVQLEKERQAVASKVVELINNSEVDGVFYSGEAYDALKKKLTTEMMEGQSKVGKIKLKIYKLKNKVNKQALRSLDLQVKDRTKFAVDKFTKGKVYEHGLVNWKREGYLRSTGEFNRFQNRNLQDMRDFYQKKLYVRESQRTESALDSITNVRAHAAEDNARAFYMHRDKYRDKWDRQGGISLNRHADPDTYVHEMGHHVEYRVDGIQRRANEFKRYRFAHSGVQNRKMDDAFPTFNYDVSEIGNEDDFLRAFDPHWQPGRVYGPNPTNASLKAAGYSEDTRQALNKAMYTGKTYAGRDSTEIISMGMQQLSKDPIGFAQRDPEYFKFIAGILDGTIR